MKNITDRISRLIYVALNFLFLRNPERSALGVCVGLCFEMLVKIFEPSIQQMQGVDFSGIASWHYIIFGVTLLHSPSILKRTVFSSELDESTERALAVIRKAKEAGVSEWHLKRMYLDLCEKALKNAVMSEQIRRELEDNNRDTESEE